MTAPLLYVMLRPDACLCGLERAPGFAYARADSAKTFALVGDALSVRGTLHRVPHTGDVEAARRALRNRLDRVVDLVAEASPMTADELAPETHVVDGLLYVRVPLGERRILTSLF